MDSLAIPNRWRYYSPVVPAMEGNGKCKANLPQFICWLRKCIKLKSENIDSNIKNVRCDPMDIFENIWLHAFHIKYSQKISNFCLVTLERISLSHRVILSLISRGCLSQTSLLRKTSRILFENMVKRMGCFRKKI